MLSLSTLMDREMAGLEFAADPHRIDVSSFRPQIRTEC